jgi:hypothetical protein
MAGTYIEYDSKKFELQELTIEKWQNIMKFKDIYDEVDMYIMMISEMTGLEPEQVRDGDAQAIVSCGELLHSYINQESKQVFHTMKHKGVEYELVDFSNITFGQFVDIDSFVMKDESYKVANLNELAAYLYTEKGKKYGETNFKKNIENFKQLPLKYIEGAVFFLWTLEKGLFGLSELYSKNKWMWRGIKIVIISRNFGDTISGLLNSQRTKFGKLMVLLVSPLFFVSTICRILVTYVRKKRKQLKNK